MKSLNEVYSSEFLHYWCNAAGDINIPDADPAYCGKPEEMPLKAKDLYLHYWTEDMGTCMYVVEMNEQYGLAFTFLFDSATCADYAKKSEETINDNDMRRMLCAIEDSAKFYEKDERLCGCEVLVGDKTDPDGHELMFFFPYENRKGACKAIKAIIPEVYDFVGELF